MSMFASKRAKERAVWEEGHNSFNLTPLNLKRRSARADDYFAEQRVGADVKNTYQELPDDSKSQDEHHDEIKDPNLLHVPVTSRQSKRISLTPSLRSLAPSIAVSFSTPPGPPTRREVVIAEETKIMRYEQRYKRESCGPGEMHLTPPVDLNRRRSSVISVPRTVERRPEPQLFPSHHIPGLPLGVSFEQLLRSAIHKMIPGMIIDAYPLKLSSSNDPFSRVSYEQIQNVTIQVKDIKAEFTKQLATTPKPVAGNWFLVKDHRGKSVGRGFYVAWRSNAGIKTWVQGVHVTSSGTVKRFGSETESEIKNHWRPTMWAAI